MQKFTQKGDMWASPEVIDETTEFPDQETALAPIKFDFAELRFMNSYGTRNLIRFIKSWQPKDFEYHNCPPVLVELFNVVDALLGTPPDIRFLKSFKIPFFDPDSDSIQDILFLTDEVSLDQGDFSFTESALKRLKDNMVSEVEPDEYLAFYDRVNQ